ncbi:hypothetical protein MN116_002740 [Schistosoma mekongi]|uniref:Tegument antigen n=1 Tax=Schistosoma mekongi TaxID=38744 RepID=A0AAE1ZFN2_SCHME|nr:hypothetical protein MN116_002740 [Schistosoma mekongi]
MVIKLCKQDGDRSSLTKRILEVFFKNDKDHNEIITNNQLKRYIETNKLDVDLIEKWTQMFQIKNTNQLSLEDICEHLQLNIKDVRQQRDTQLKLGYSSASINDNNQQILGNDIQVIIDQMPMEMKLKITNEFRKLFNTKNDFNELKATEYMKSFMDKHFSSSWVVLIVKGSYSATFLHLEDCSFQFRINNHNFIVWRTFIGFN